MAKDNYWVSAGLYTLLQRGSDFLFGFFGFYFLVRILSKDDFGLWVLYITVLAVVDMARNGFLQNGLIRYLVQVPTEASGGIQAAAWKLNVGITVFCGLLLAMLAPWLSRLWNFPQLPAMLWVFYASLLFFIPFTQMNVLLQARMQFRPIFLIQLLRSAGFFAFIVWLWWQRQTTTLMALAIALAASMAAATLLAWWLTRHLLAYRPEESREWTGKLFHFGKYVFGTNLMSMISNSLDKFVLGALLSPAGVATNNVAGRMLNFIEVPINTVATVVYPKSAASMQQDGEAAKEGVRRLFEQSVGVTLGMTVPFYVGMMLLAEPVILLIAGDGYRDAVPFFRVILAVALLRPYDRQSGVTLDAMGRPGLNFSVVSFSLVLTTVLSIFFIQWQGLMGAAYAVVLSLMVSVVIKQVLLHKLLGVTWWKPLLHMADAYRMIWQKLHRR